MFVVNFSKQHPTDVPKKNKCYVYLTVYNVDVIEM